MRKPSLCKQQSLNAKIKIIRDEMLRSISVCDVCVCPLRLHQKGCSHTPIVLSIHLVTKAFLYRDRAGWPASLLYIRRIRVSVAIGTQSGICLHERIPMINIWGPPQLSFRKNPTLAASLVKASLPGSLRPPTCKVPPIPITRVESRMIRCADKRCKVCPKAEGRHVLFSTVSETPYVYVP